MSEIYYEDFPLLLEQRLLLSRKTCNWQLAPIMFKLVLCLGSSQFSPFLKETLDEKIGSILADCEIFPLMSEPKALDSLSELSSLAAVYYTDEKKSTYNRICSLIRKIRASYPVRG